MKTNMKNIKFKISNCKELLTLFKKERQIYQTKTRVEVNEVMNFLKIKQQLVNIFDDESPSSNQHIEQISTNKEDQQTLMRELSSLLEQLLVIDQENEKLLRKLLSSNNTSTKKVSQTVQQNSSRSPQRSNDQNIATQNPNNAKKLLLPRTYLREYKKTNNPNPRETTVSQKT